MRLPLFRVLFGLWYAVVFYAQAPSNTGAIAGIVLDRESNAPIRRVVVTLSTVEARPQDAVAWTDATGRFAFGYLPPGRYQLRAQKIGYQLAAFGAESSDPPPAIITLEAGENHSEIVIRLQPLGAISGVVLDEDGDPVAGAQVAAFRPGFQRQKRKLLQGPSIATDSRGRYRLQVVPGRYALVVSHMFQPGLKAPPEVVAGQNQQQYARSVQYYPGTDRSASAALLEVKAGKELEGIDFRLTGRPAVTLQGRVVPPREVAPGGQVGVTILELDSPQSMHMPAGVSSEFTFRIDNLAPGAYLAVAQASAEGRQYRGTQRFELGEGSNEVTIPLEPAIDLAGRVTVEGPGAAQHSAQYVGLVPGDGIPWQGEPLRAKVNKDGTFKVMNVPPGVWDINAGPIPPGGYIKSMRLGEQDVLTEEMVIRSATTAPLKIVLSTQAAVVEGSVTKLGSQSQRSVVLLAPEGKFRHVLSFYQLTASDEKGRFEIKGATPGSYKLYAFEELTANSIEDPEFLKPFERFGTPVQLKEGQNTSQDLTLIPAGARGNQ